jgi:plasmid stabilization system protein ParE
VGQVRWTAAAERWLRRIHDHIADDSPAAAQSTIQGIYDKAESLDRFPERGYLHTTKRGKTVRVLLYGHYRIAYRTNQDGDVSILGVFHGALDIHRHLR